MDAMTARALRQRYLEGDASQDKIILYLLFLKKQPMKTASVQERYQNDVRPGQNSALLKLTNCKTILLDDSAPRTIPKGNSGEAYFEV